MIMCIQNFVTFCPFILKILNDQRSNGPVNAHLISGPRITRPSSAVRPVFGRKLFKPDHFFGRI